MRKRKPFRDGRVHVMAEKCESCIFHRGNRMQLNRGRVAMMVEEATRKQSAITCHETLDGLQAVCRGFFDKFPTQPLQIAERLGFVTFVEPQKNSK